jgi:predicted RND superfamily exporter protein
MSNDLLTTGFRRVERTVFEHHKLCMMAIFMIIAVMLFGTPLIRSDTQLLRMLTDSTPELTDLRFVENNLAPVNSLELIVKAEENALKSPDFWKKIRGVEERLNRIPEVAATDSFLPFMEYLYGVVGGRDARTGDVFTNPGLLPELIFMTSFSAEGKRLLSRYFDDQFSQLHISIRIRNSPSTTIRQTIDEIRSAAEEGMNGYGKVMVTGDLVVFEAQASEIVSSQTYSLLLAILYMTILLTIQFRSLALGLISLFPQILPQAVIFGMMGWFGISLDSVTVFAASVSIGLTVDNTVHYLTQLKREISARGQTQTIEQCLSAAYEVTARAMISNHAVIFFGFAMLLISPFRPVVYFGILGSAAILCSLIGDLVFMPSTILSSSFIRKLLTREMTGKVMNNRVESRSEKVSEAG